MTVIPHPGFDARTRQDGVGTTLALSGELDCATAELAYAEVKLAAAVAHELTIDPRGLTFMDAAGLHVLLYAREQFARLSIVRGNAHVERLIELAGLSARFMFVSAR
ncbi:STAS domain-containing protein [Solirubrobacter sp. CPCC 204708]|uniref:STAS domain-containing protein n=1 Tax=Solirubrobacter deserti TaxID=2282478 RepID=A0ABT4RTL2_9ACTN|nr:STAS domain-containing protein [Solirubrobacter deserti]MBE2315899.1 STAS domain-containing protein [Solirubrobacter deserti]MDA0141580.1 STAS domain-containing protein [Solirubrobacter deserti]